MDKVTDNGIGFTLEEYKRGRDLFKKLSKEYGISVLNIQMVIGEEDSRLSGFMKKMFIVVDVIQGSNLDKVTEFPLEALEEVDNFFSAIVRHYHDAYKNGGDYWTDLAMRNLIYGRIGREERNKVYIFDVDPYYKTYDPAKPSNDIKGNIHLRVMLSVVGSNINILEHKFHPPQELVKTRKALNSLIKDRREEDLHF